MNDVLGQIVFTKGDVNLLPKEAISTIGLRFGAGTHHRKVATCLWLSQVHRTGPLTADQMRHPALLHFGGTSRHESFDGTIGQQGAQRE